MKSKRKQKTVAKTTKFKVVYVDHVRRVMEGSVESFTRPTAIAKAIKKYEQPYKEDESGNGFSRTVKEVYEL